MKKRLLLIPMMALLSGCEGIGKNKYIYTETVRSDVSGISVRESVGIYAKTDSAAYIDALDRFEIAKDVAYSIEKSIDKKYISYPISFTLENSSGEIVYFENLMPTYPSKGSIKNKEDEEMQRKAFAGAEFGMTKEDVSQIPPFDDRSEWSVYDNCIKCFRYTIGNGSYTVELFFHDNELYCVTFTSVSYRSATYLDSDIKKEVENFKDIIKETYDYPTYNYGLPSILNINSGRITWAYKWKIGYKEINIGVGEESSGSKYRMYAEIIDSQKYNSIKAEREKKKENTTKEASAQF